MDHHVDKVYRIIASAVMIVFFLIWYASEFAIGMRALLAVVMRLAFLILAGALIYQAYDAFRPALTGTQVEASAPVEEPESFSNRLAAFIWGVMESLMSIFPATLALNIRRN